MPDKNEQILTRNDSTVVNSITTEDNLISSPNYDYDISIVIVNYNVRDFLNKCLNSINASQTNLKIQTIVVDNHSTDGSINYLRNIYQKAEFYELNENLGFSKANNVGFTKAKGKYVLILNPDTILSTDTLQVMYEYMEKNQEVWISGCKILNPDGSFQLPCRRGFPTPWVAFSKLFGLQTIFPKSKLFARYNQTFRSVDETYYIDALMGAFMFARTDKLKQIKGFDEDYFMYGEDLDLCYRTVQSGGKVAYVHSTSIVHFKGESTKRSSINDIKHFYEAMQIFVKKHYGNSSFFLILLKIGIFLRTQLAYLFKYKKDFPLIVVDILFVNLALLLSTNIRFEKYLGFPDYAYPIVFIMISIVHFLSLFSVGEYFEGEHSIRKFLFGNLFTFFFLTALTYFFRDFAFSRGVLLMTIGLTFILGSSWRMTISTYKNERNRNYKKRIAFVSESDKFEEIGNLFDSNQLGENIDFVGAFNFNADNIHYEDNTENIPIIGNYDFLLRNLSDLKLDEILIYKLDRNLEKFSDLFSKTLDSGSKVYFISNLGEYLSSFIISKVTSSPTILINHKLILPRYKFIKRIIDISSALLMLSLGLPHTLIKNRKDKKYLKKTLYVLNGKYSLIGIYPSENIRNYNAKPGLMNLAEFSPSTERSNETIQKLNDYYELNYSISLDFDIFIKNLLKRGN